MCSIMTTTGTEVYLEYISYYMGTMKPPSEYEVPWFPQDSQLTYKSKRRKYWIWSHHIKHIVAPLNWTTSKVIRCIHAGWNSWLITLTKCANVRTFLCRGICPFATWVWHGTVCGLNGRNLIKINYTVVRYHVKSTHITGIVCHVLYSQVTIMQKNFKG